MGSVVIYEAIIPEKPVSLLTYFDACNKPNLPVIAVAAGSSIYYFKDFSQSMKFDLPLLEYSEQESQIWGELMKLTQ